MKFSYVFLHSALDFCRFLDYSKACAQVLEGASSVASCIVTDGLAGDSGTLCMGGTETLSFFKYLITKGLILAVSGPASAIVMSIICAKHGRHESAQRSPDSAAISSRTGAGGDAARFDACSDAAGVGGGDNDDETEQEDCWPLESFGVHVLPGLRPHLAALTAWLRSRLSLCSSTCVVAWLCGPAAGYFLLKSFQARLDRAVGEASGGAQWTGLHVVDGGGGIINRHLHKRRSGPLFQAPLH